MAVLEVLVKAVDEASKTLADIGKTGGQVASGLEMNWKKIGLATAATGAAFVALGEKTKGTELAIKNLATQTGLTESESRKLTASLINTTFSLQDANDTLAVAAQRGVQGADALSNYAQFWDLVGTASGETSAELAKSAIALEALGISTDNQAEALDAYGFVVSKTGASIQEFNRFVGRLAPEMNAMGISVNDAAAILGGLQNQGMDSRLAMSEFRKAATEADGDMQTLIATLGISNEQFAELQQQVAGSGDILIQQAQNAEETRTAMDSLRAMMQRLGVTTGPLIAQLANLGPALMAVGPIIKGVAVAKNLWAAATAKVNVALLANPIGIVIAAIVGLVAAGALVVKNWDSIKAAAASLWQSIRTAFQSIVQFISQSVGSVLRVWQGVWRDMAQVVVSARDAIVRVVQAIMDRVQKAVEAVKRLGRLGRGSGSSGGSSGSDVPTMHTGGIFRAPIAGGEGLALLRDGEQIIPRGAEDFSSQRIMQMEQAREMQRIRFQAKRGMPTSVRTQTTPFQQLEELKQQQIAINMGDMFRGANIQMSGPGDVERMNQQLFGLLKTRLRAAG